MNNKSKPLEQRFWKYVVVGSKDICWEWIGGKIPDGYGSIYCHEAKRARLAHRVSWEIHNGPIPDGMVICHKCDNPSCVNPNHLFLGTQLDNMHDRDRKGRHGRPESRKTHCPYGHPYSGDNVYIDHGSRMCRTCTRKRQRQRHYRQIAEHYFDKRIVRAVFDWLKENNYEISKK